MTTEQSLKDQVSRLDALVDGLRAELASKTKTMDVYAKYTRLLVEELNETCSIAYANGWRSANFETGKALREELATLQSRPAGEVGG